MGFYICYQILVVVTYNLKNVGDEGVSIGIDESFWGSPLLVTTEGQALKSNQDFTKDYEEQFDDEDNLQQTISSAPLNPGSSMIQYEVYEVDRNFWEENDFLFANKGLHAAEEYYVYFTDK